MHIQFHTRALTVHTHTLILTFTHEHKQCPSYQTHTCTHSLTHTLTHIHTFTSTQTHIQRPSCQTHTYSHLQHAHTHTHAFVFTHTPQQCQSHKTHTHTHTLSLYLSHTYSLSHMNTTSAHLAKHTNTLSPYLPLTHTQTHIRFHTHTPTVPISQNALRIFDLTISGESKMSIFDDTPCDELILPPPAPPSNPGTIGFIR